MRRRIFSATNNDDSLCYIYRFTWVVFFWKVSLITTTLYRFLLVTVVFACLFNLGTIEVDLIANNAVTCVRKTTANRANIAQF